MLGVESIRVSLVWRSSILRFFLCDCERLSPLAAECNHWRLFPHHNLSICVVVVYSETTLDFYDDSISLMKVRVMDDTDHI